MYGCNAQAHLSKLFFESFLWTLGHHYQNSNGSANATLFVEVPGLKFYGRSEALNMKSVLDNFISPGNSLSANSLVKLTIDGILFTLKLNFTGKQPEVSLLLNRSYKSNLA